MAKYVGYKRPKDTKKTLKHLFSYLGLHKWSFVCVAVLVFISAGANIAGTYLLKPVINHFIMPGDMNGLIKAVTGMGIMYFCGATCTLLYNRLMVKTSQKVIQEIRNDLFAHTQKLPLSYFDAHTHGELMSRFTNDVDTIQEAMNNSFAMIIQSFIMLTGTIIMMMVLSIQLSLIVIVFLIIMFFFIRFNGKHSKKYFNRQQSELGKINGFVQEMAEGQKVEKVFNHEEIDFNNFCKLNENLRKESTSALTFSGMMIPTIVSLSYLNYALSACVGGLLAIRGLIDLGSLSAYLVYVRQSAMPLNQFTQQVNFLLSALSGAERIFDMMDTEPEIDNGTVTLCNANKSQDGTLTESPVFTGTFAWKVPEIANDSTGLAHTDDVHYSYVELKGDVRFNNVVFGYMPQKKVLNDISLYAKPGHKIAFVGSTGAGKTTMVKLLMRFYDVNSGCIKVDGHDIRDFNRRELRDAFGMVLQDTWLYKDTIMENIRYGRLDATDEEVIAAAKAAHAHHFIETLPGGYNMELNEDASNVSQGQKQLLLIAGAILADNCILILDAATSSVDTRTELQIQKAMDNLMEGRTSFVIAHRLSTIKNADCILVMKDGDIIEQGNHEELMKKDGFYADLYNSQFDEAS